MSVVQVDSSKGDSNIYRNLLAIPAIVFAIGAQLAVANGMIALGIAGYVFAIACAVIAVRKLPGSEATVSQESARLNTWWRIGLVVAALITTAGAFADSGGNRYRIPGVILWIASIIFWWLAWFVRQKPQAETKPPLKAARYGTLFAFIVILAIGAAFRFVDLYDNPREMNSDHAEKLLDINDVLSGTDYIFFERNTGREPWEFYWVTALIKIFNLRPDFMALKIGTSLIGVLMLPGIFLFVRELFGGKVALIAMLFAAVASWGVLAARFGLRHGLNPAAVAWTMYFLVRGLRRSERNSMLVAGISFGIGLQGYTAYRGMIAVVPFIIFVWVLWQIKQRKDDLARRALIDAGLALCIAALVMMPLLRYITEHPDRFLSRAMTRVSSEEQPIEGSVPAILINNVKNVLLVFNYTKDEVWVTNLPDRPAVDEVLGGLLVIGTAVFITTGIKRKDPWPVLIVASAFIMLMPSALSIAFPRENPSVLRIAGALPMVMCICAIVPGALLDTQTWKIPAIGLVLVLCAIVIGVNTTRVFIDYPAQYCPRAQNASDIAQQMNDWVAAGHSRTNAYIVGFPNWVDSRAVGVWIGDIHFPNTVGAAIGSMDVSAVDLHGQPGWFAMNENDSESISALLARYPHGQLKTIFGSQCSVKHFVVFTTQ